MIFLFVSILQVLLPYTSREPPYMAIKEPIPVGYTTPKAL